MQGISSNVHQTVLTITPHRTENFADKKVREVK